MKLQNSVEEKNGLYRDFYNNIVPKRMPVKAYFPFTMISEYGNVDAFDMQYNYSALKNATIELCKSVYSDCCPASPPELVTRPVSFYQLLESQSFKIGTNGIMQHPEVIGMYDNEYPDLIEKPFDFLLEKVIPRHYKKLSLADPINRTSAVMAAKASFERDVNDFMPIYTEIMEQFGYYNSAPANAYAGSTAPCDFIADHLRSFSEINFDLRRHREELKQACDAIVPYMLKWAIPKNPAPEGSAFFPLHMPTFIREKDFVEVWLPSFKTVIEQLSARGVRPSIFCESDWTRYLDIISDVFPAGSLLQFEFGDPKQIKDKLGKKFMLTRLFPLRSLKTDSKSEIIDRVKAFFDIMLPGGGYIFDFDKVPLGYGDVNIETWAALNEYIRDNVIFENAGESFGTPLNSEGLKIDENLLSSISSKYLFDWSSFKNDTPFIPDSAKQRFMDLDDQNFNFYLNLLG